jgi:ribosomal protein L37AE/L43A
MEQVYAAVEERPREERTEGNACWACGRPEAEFIIAGYPICEECAWQLAEAGGAP